MVAGDIGVATPRRQRTAFLGEYDRQRVLIEHMSPHLAGSARLSWGVVHPCGVHGYLVATSRRQRTAFLAAFVRGTVTCPQPSPHLAGSARLSWRRLTSGEAIGTIDTLCERSRSCTARIAPGSGLSAANTLVIQRERCRPSGRHNSARIPGHKAAGPAVAIPPSRQR